MQGDEGEPWYAELMECRMRSARASPAMVLCVLSLLHTHTSHKSLPPLPRCMAQPFRPPTCGQVVALAARDNTPSFIALLPHEIRIAIDVFVLGPAWHWSGKLSASSVARITSTYSLRYLITTKGEVLGLRKHFGYGVRSH